MILNHIQLEQFIGSCLTQLINFKSIRVTGLLSGAACGKTTLIKAIKYAACNVGGFVITDMSEIIDWHRDEKNHSVLKGSFDAAQLGRQNGDLVEDSLIFAGFVGYLVYEQGLSAFGELRGVAVSGLPRKEIQAGYVLKYFPLFRMAYINCPFEEADKWRMNRIKNGIVRDDDKPEMFHRRWKKFHAETEPNINQFQIRFPGRFTLIDYRRTPHQKAVLLLKSMGLEPNEHNSLLHQLVTSECKAWQHLDAVLNPDKYKSVPTGRNHSTPQLPFTIAAAAT